MDELEQMKDLAPGLRALSAVVGSQGVAAAAVAGNFEITYLMKKDRISLERDNLYTFALASGISLQLAKFLEQQSFSSVPLSSNFVHRDDVQGIELRSMTPD